MRILRNKAATLTVTFYVGEVATDATGTPTIAIAKENGTTLVAATSTGVTKIATGTYSYTLSPQAQLDVLAVTWTGTVSGATQTLTDEVEIVGGEWATLAEIRSLDSVGDTTVFTTAELQQAADEAAELFEDYCETAFVPRYARDILDGDGEDTLYLTKQRVRSLIDVTVGDTVETTTDWAVYPDGKVVRDTGTFTAGERNVKVRYEHGTSHPPADLKRAWLVYVRTLLLSANDRTWDRALSLQTEVGHIQMAQPGANRPTGIPQVDAVLNRYKSAVPAVR